VIGDVKCRVVVRNGVRLAIDIAFDPASDPAFNSIFHDIFLISKTRNALPDPHCAIAFLAAFSCDRGDGRARAVCSIAMVFGRYLGQQTLERFSRAV
jgi:hypothetical protein